MADRQKVSSLISQAEYDPTPLQKVSSVILQAECSLAPTGLAVTSLVAQVECEESSAEPPYDDGTPSGGIVFGGEVVEIGVSSYTDPAASGGIVFGGAETSADEVYMVEGAASGGIVFGGESTESWEAIPNNAVAVKGGTYRIAGALYTLDELLTYPGLGSIAAIVDCNDPPGDAGDFRYDLLSIDIAGAITVTAGTEATTPVMPATPSGEIKLNHVLRYYGQTTIIQADIGKLWTAPALTTITPVATDDELAWAELTTNVTVTFRDQYGQLFTGAKVINATFASGNGTIAPASKSGTGSSWTFVYTRDQNDPGDISPTIQFTDANGVFGVEAITLLDSGGDPMY